MKQTAITLDDNFLSFVARRKEDISTKLKELAILELYRRKEISSGKAAELLDMERFEFVQYASRLGLPFFDISREELLQDTATARSVAEEVR